MDHRLLPLACLLLLLAPAASAGTGADPEVADGASDADAAGALDITGAYVDASDPYNVTFHILVPKLVAAPADAGTCAAGTDCASLAFSFYLEFAVVSPDGVTPDPPGYAGTAVVFRNGAPAGIRAAIGHRDTNGTLHLARAIQGSAGIGEVILSAPRADSALRIPAGAQPGAYRLTGLVASSAPELCGPPLQEETAATGVTVDACTALPPPGQAQNVPNAPQQSRWDVAPDLGAGRDFVFPAPPPAPAPPAANAKANATSAPTAQAQPKAAPPAATANRTTAPAPFATPSPTGTTTATTSFAPIPSTGTAKAKGSPAPVLAAALGLAVALAARRRLSA